MENFFDTQHDSGTLDYTFLPLVLKKKLPGHREHCLGMTSDFYRNECLNLDWTDEKFEKKIQNMSRVIKSFDENGSGPDILILQEVENINVLNKFSTHGLSNTGLKHTVLLEGDDSRGIDVALISKYPVLKAKRHPLVINGEVVDTRGILEIHIKVSEYKIVIFNNHWPSQNHHVSQRIASAELIERISSNLDADLVIAAGDFNTIIGETPFPFNYMPSFMDAEEHARKINPEIGPGTNYFRGKWSSLDKIFIHKSSSVTANYEKFRILSHPFMMNISSTTGRPYPKRFNHSKGEGYSDHLPVCLEFNL